MKCLIKINISDSNVFKYNSTDWEERDIPTDTIDNTGVMLYPSLFEGYPSLWTYWKEITFLDKEQEEYFVKLRTIQDIIK